MAQNIFQDLGNILGTGPAAPTNQTLAQQGYQQYGLAAPTTSGYTAAPVNTAAAAPFTGAQTSLLSTLGSEAAGTGGPTTADQQLQSGIAQSLAAQKAGTAGARGPSAGLQAKDIQANAANTTAGAAGAAAAQRAQEQQAATAGLAGVAATGAQQANQVAEANQQAANEAAQFGSNLKNQQWEFGGQLGAQQQAQENAAIAGVNSQNNSFNNNLGGQALGGITSLATQGLSSLAGMGAGGGPPAGAGGMFVDGPTCMAAGGGVDAPPSVNISPLASAPAVADAPIPQFFSSGSKSGGSGGGGNPLKNMKGPTPTGSTTPAPSDPSAADVSSFEAGAADAGAVAMAGGGILGGLFGGGPGANNGVTPIATNNSNPAINALRMDANASTAANGGGAMEPLPALADGAVDAGATVQVSPGQSVITPTMVLKTPEKAHADKTSVASWAPTKIRDRDQNVIGDSTPEMAGVARGDIGPPQMAGGGASGVPDPKMLPGQPGGHIVRIGEAGPEVVAPMSEPAKSNFEAKTGLSVQPKGLMQQMAEAGHGLEQRVSGIESALSSMAKQKARRAGK